MMNNEVPFFSAEAIHTDMDLMSPITRVISRHRYILGEEVAAFETEFAHYTGVAHCVTVANGTDALELGLRAVGVQRGDQVLLVANAGCYSATALHAIGAIPHYIEVDAITLTMSAEKVREALDIKPKAIVVTHLYGQLADITSICEMASCAGIPVIEDCAQAHGAKRYGKCAGSFAQIGCFSFYPTKNLGALGDGGAVVTNDPQLYEKLIHLRQYGWQKKYYVEEPYGRNSRFDEIQAAILRDKLPYLDGANDARRIIAKQYQSGLEALPVICPASLGEDHVFFSYVIRIKKRDVFRQYLNSQKINTEIYYPVPDHWQKAYAHKQKNYSLPISEAACAEVISLPCYPGLTTAQVNQVIATVKDYFENA